MDDITLERIKNSIENMKKPQHIEVLNILKRNPCINVNENRNGVYINLSYIPRESVEELEKYIHYINDQEISLNVDEVEKEKCKNFFPIKEYKNNSVITL